MGNATTSGSIVQTYSTNTDSDEAYDLALTNSNTSATPTTVNGFNLLLTNATNSNNTSTINGINFPAASNNNLNVINGINFESATGFDYFLSTPSITISSAGDLSTTGNIETTGTGTITAAGLLTGNGGLTVSGNTNINISGSSDINIGTGTYSGDLALGNSSANIAITDANWNISGAGAANFVSIGATTPGSGAFTTLSSTGTTTLSSGAGANTVIGNGSGTFSLTSSGGLNVDTTGNLTGVSSIDTISMSSTALGFAGVGTISAGEMSNLTLDAGGSGIVRIANGSSGDVEIAGGVSSTGCTITNNTGDLACTGDITGSSDGTVGFFSRNDSTATITTATSGDKLTLGGLLTAGAGLSVTGATDINTSGGSAINIGTGTYSGNLTLGNSSANIAITDANWNISGAGAANFVSIGATTPGSGAFTTLSSTGTTSLGNDSNTVAIDSSVWDISSTGLISGITGYTQATGNFTVNGDSIVSLGTGTGNVTIGNGSGTFSLTSSGGLNVDTTGNLTGVSSIDTISMSSTALGFAGVGTISAGGNSNLTLDAGGSGIVRIANGSSGDVEIAGGVSSTGCTITNNTGDLACTGDITGSSSGTVGYWTRDALGVITPATGSDIIAATGSASTIATFTATGSNNALRAGGATDFVAINANGDISTPGDIDVTGTGTITSAGLITASTGLTATTGDVEITAGELTLNGTTRIANDGTGTFVSGTTIGSQTFTTNNIADSGSLTIATGSDGDLTLDANGTGTTILADSTITLSALTGDRALFLDSSSNVVTTADSSVLISSINDETGTGVLVFNDTPDITSPNITTSITTGSTSFDLLNTTAETINFGGGATTEINIGPSGDNGQIVLSGGSGDTGCTLNGVNGDLTCSGDITGSSREQLVTGQGMHSV